MRIRGQVAIALAAAAMVPAGSAYAQYEGAPTHPTKRLPTADQPIVRAYAQPTLSFEGGAGILGFVVGGTSLGPAWNVRVTGAFTPRFSLEGTYMGSANQHSFTGDMLVMTAFDLGARINLLLPQEFPVQPFLAAGAGYAGFSGRYGDTTTLVVPLSGGIERMLTPNVKIGARLQYRPAFFDDLGSPAKDAGSRPGADTWTLLAQIGGGF